MAQFKSLLMFLLVVFTAQCVHAQKQEISSKDSVSKAAQQESNSRTETTTSQKKDADKDATKSSTKQQDRAQDSRPLTERQLREIDDAIAQLDDDKHATRVAATQYLLKQSELATPKLVDALDGASLESQLRLFRVLESLYEKTSERSDYLASEAIEELADSKDANISRTANRILQSHSRIRGRVAVFQIARLGGKMQNELAGSTLQSLPTRPALFIMPEWSGGDDGLKHVFRLEQSQVYSFSVYIIRGAKISEKAQLKLRSILGDVRVARRSAVKLGISWNNRIEHDDGCIVSGVTKGGAADLGGIQREDIIVEVDGQPIKSRRAKDGTVLSPFDVLIKTLEDYSADQECEIGVLRNNVPRKLKVTLQGW